MAIDVERLIESVRRHAYLYDLGHKDYKNTARKAAIWEEIAEDLNENSETVKLKWKTVRDGYIKYKKQLKESNGKKAINYIWSSQLQFLDDYQVSRKKKEPQPNVTLPPTLQLSEDESETPSQSYSPASILIPSPSDSGPFRSEPTPSRKRRDQEKNNYVKTKKTKKEIHDATDHLFLSYSETFKTFTLRQQALLKVELAKLFSTAELSALQSFETLQEPLVAGSSDRYVMGNECRQSAAQISQDIHTVEDDDSDNDNDVQVVNPKQKRERRPRRHRTSELSD